MRRAKQERLDTQYEEAAAIVSAFWGESNGSPEALALAQTRLRQLKPDLTVLHRLRLDLPPAHGGTTGQRLARADRLLKSLEHEARGN